MTPREFTDEQLEQLQDTLAAAAAGWAAGLQPADPEPEAPAVGTIKPRVTQTTEQGVALAWEPVPGATSYVLVRDGVDRDGHGIWRETLTAPATAHTFLKLKAETRYTFGVDAIGADGADLALGEISVTTLPEPKPVDPPAPGTPGKLAPVGRSKTGTNVIVFGPQTLTELTAWERKYGVQVDGLLTYAWRETEERFLNEQFWRQAGEIAATGRVVVISLPWAPESEGSGMNAKAAKGGYVALHRKIAALILKYGLNRENVVLRLCWEYNGVWYAWSTTNGGAALFKAAWLVTVTTFRAAGITKPLWAQTANKGPQTANRVTGADVFVPGATNIVGLDHYNFWPPQNDDAGWAAAVAQVPGLTSQRALASVMGAQWSVDETGPANPASKDYGGDGAGFARRMVDYIRKNKGAGLAYFTIYDHEGAPKELNHTIDANPNWRSEVLGALKSGW
ncbi:fibronectin type III domain-containing protein [Kineosporia succinea]|uniref:Fibronectin type III domain protein n=1 Tax=Kineosporia succinea TaxID=84632 RepID=A0ABT9P635_9ACTN|nr:fibronectin type III domain-containing protein [Kineosporia succinea]MDP9828031.1 hypothetical protein [Kineosporia succinea]